MDILEVLTRQLGGDALGQISRQLGTDEKTAGNATAAGVTALIGALSRNAGKAGGAAQLDHALAKDHDGSVLDNLTGFLGNPDTETGQGQAAGQARLLGCVESPRRAASGDLAARPAGDGHAGPSARRGRRRGFRHRRRRETRHGSAGQTFQQVRGEGRWECSTS
jgi:hypothetical protein